MQVLVCKIRPDDVVPVTTTKMQMSRKDAVRIYHTDVKSAISEATTLSKENPGTQYGVFVLQEIYETLPPPPPKVVKKVLNEAGEIVVAQP